ncbi:GAF domain-containing protein [bacterium]|nr:GAF domain-containing protein [bacterium]
MDAAETLTGRYERIAAQLAELCAKTTDPVARMATAAAVLHHKMPRFFWTGFYLLKRADKAEMEDGRDEYDLVVGPYQGPLACAVLKRGEGVCWACVKRGEPVVVPDVHAFPGHIACDSRSKSEVVVPLFAASGRLAGVLDVDSEQSDAFSDTDAEGLTHIAGMIFRAV